MCLDSGPMFLSSLAMSTFALVALFSIFLPSAHAQGTNATCLPGFEWVRAVAHLDLRVKIDSVLGLDV